MSSDEEKKPKEEEGKKYHDYVPIPATPKGNGYKFVVDHEKYVMKIDVFLDFGCPWCAFFYEKIWKPMQEYYFKNKENVGTKDKAGYGDIAMTFHFYPLPYIHCSWTMAKTATYLMYKRPEIFEAFMDNYFPNEKKVRPHILEKLNDEQTVKLIYEEYLKQFDVDEKDYVETMMKYKNACFLKTAMNFKYIVSRGITTTPSFMVNDALIEGRWDFPEWQRLLDKTKKSMSEMGPVWV